MPSVAFIVAASPTPAFFSQVAVICRALRRLEWKRWVPSVYLFLGEEKDGVDPEYARWLPHLTEVELHHVSAVRCSREGNWAQVDAKVRNAPRDADVVVALDADTLPVGNLEEILDRVVELGGVAGVIAHFPFPAEGSPWDNWARAAGGVLPQPLEFEFVHTLVEPHEADTRRLAPFYLNGGVVFFARDAYASFAPRYLELRQLLAGQMQFSDFSGQVALTLSVVDKGLPKLALPMRYNFPNDPIAERLHASEIEHIKVYHYLRTQTFDRHKIFATPAAYEEFLSLDLTGINKKFQDEVRRIVGEPYPF